MRDASTGILRAVFLGGALVAAIWLVGSGTTAMAQEQQQQGQQAQAKPKDQEKPPTEQFKEEVVVTGTLIPRPTLEAMTPVATMDVEELTYQGTTRLEDLLSTLPQVFRAQNSTVSNGASGTATVDLRYLGSQRTLVLVDGRRLPAGDIFEIAPDLNFIPAALVKRVDVLTGGASSVYGADAVAGVVNFILDKDFVGMKAGLSGGGFQHENNNDFIQGIQAKRGFTSPTGRVWDGGQFDAYAAFGGKFGEDKGHATVYVDYRQTAALLKGSRDYTNCSVLGLSASGVACGGSSTSPTGRFFTDDGKSWTVDPTTGNTFAPWASKYLFNYAPYNYMQRPDTRYAAGGFVNYDWNEHFQGYADVMLMDDNTDAQIAPSGDFGNTLSVNCDNPMLSPDMYQKICVDNGYGPHDIAGVQVLRRNIEGGGRVDQLSHQSFRLSAGLKGDINKSWNYDVYGLHGETRRPESYHNDFNTNALQNALIVDGDPADPSTWQCRDAAARAAGCVPWNIFKKGGVTPQALAYLQLPLVSNGDVKTELVSGKLTGDLKDYGLAFPSAAEGISVALGAEYRKESLDFEPDLAFQLALGAGQGGPTLPVSGFYSVKEAFLETTIPIVQGAKGAQNLVLDLGYRYSDYNLSGSHPSWKVAGTWSPINDFKVRAGRNRAVRAPNAVELFSPQGLGLGGSVDPCAGIVANGETPTFNQTQCARMGVPANIWGTIAPSAAQQYNTLGGGNPLLNPETADTTTYGVVITPAGFSGFTAALDYYKIKIDGRIGSLGADDILKQCGETGAPSLCNLIHRDQFYSLWRTPNGYTTTTNQNIGALGSEGVDASLSYILPAGNSFFNFNLIGTYLLKADINTGLFSYDCVGFFGNQCGNPTPTWRHLARISWETGDAVISLGWRMVGSVKVDASSDNPALSDPGSIPAYIATGGLKYPAYNYIDLAASYKVLPGVQVTLGVNNIADKEPPLGVGFSPNDYGTGFYGTYDPYGRYIHSSIQFSF